MGAGALGRVERKGVRRGVLEGHARRGAHQVARVETLLPGPVVVDGHRALALAHRLLQRGHQPFAGLLADHEAVDHQVDGVYLVAVEAHAGRDFADLAVDARVDVPLFGQRLEQLPVVALAALDHRGHERDAPPVEAPEDEVGDLVVGVVDHLLARNGRIGPRGTRVEQAQEIVDLRDGAHGRAGILVGRLLLDGHHGAQPRDLIDVGTLHRPHELPRVGRERLHVAALPLGVDRVEGQRRFARPREAGDDYQFAARNFEVHVLEVVNPGAQYFDRIFHFRYVNVRNVRFIGSQISNVQRYVFFQYIVFSAVVAVRVPTLKKRSPPECLAAFRTDFTRITGINGPTRRSGGCTSYRKDSPGTTRRRA